jgi:hypothetical protein
MASFVKSVFMSSSPIEVVAQRQARNCRAKALGYRLTSEAKRSDF